MEHLEILYDHYKETFELSKGEQEKRNKCFVIVCLIEALSFLMFIQPDTASDILLSIINSNTENPLLMGSSILQTLLWILVLYTLIRYCQHNTYIERQYSYIERLESEISNQFNDFKFDRESGNYLNDYPFFLDLIHIFYTWFAPILFLVINTVRITKEWQIRKCCLSVICDSIIFIAIVIVTLAYMVAIHPRLKRLFTKENKKEEKENG